MSINYAKKNYIETDVPGLVKDKSSGAILNIDNAKLDAYKKQKRASKESEMVVETVKQLSKDIEDIKVMISQLIGKSN